MRMLARVVLMMPDTIYAMECELTDVEIEHDVRVVYPTWGPGVAVRGPGPDRVTLRGFVLRHAAVGRDPGEVKWSDAPELPPAPKLLGDGSEGGEP